MKKALITGCTGQDGSYLTELLFARGYEVHGLKRCASNFPWRTRHASPWSCMTPAVNTPWLEVLLMFVSSDLPPGAD